MHIKPAIETGVDPVQHVLIEKHLTQCLTRVLVQGDQQAVFGSSQAGVAALMGDVLSRFVEQQRAVLPGRRCTLYHRHAPQQRIDAGIQFSQAERLGQVVVGAPGKTGNPVLLGTQRRHQHHRYVLVAAQGFEQR
ncbi:hypothetical protein D3C72_1928910 [compost metagenome]